VVLRKLISQADVDLKDTGLTDLYIHVSDSNRDDDAL